MRKLATIRVIDGIQPIQGADAIECAVVGGWKVVVKKGEFLVGESALYLEIDSWVPHELAPFLTKGDEAKEFEGVKGNRLRTVKLRGQISQGLLLPLAAISDDNMTAASEGSDEKVSPPNGWGSWTRCDDALPIVRQHVALQIAFGGQ
jgi:RNA ligase (TIGR02306 family)